MQIEGEVIDNNSHLNMGYAIFNEEGALLFWSLTTDSKEENWPKLNNGKVKLRSRLPSRFINEGTYRVELLSSLHFIQFLTEPGVNAPAVYLTIQGGLSDSPYWMIKRPGFLAPVINWKKVD